MEYDTGTGTLQHDNIPEECRHDSDHMISSYDPELQITSNEAGTILTVS